MKPVFIITMIILHFFVFPLINTEFNENKKDNPTKIKKVIKTILYLYRIYVHTLVLYNTYIIKFLIYLTMVK